MRRQNRQSPLTHRIPSITNNEDLVLWEIGDLAAVLQILCIAKGDDAFDLVFDGLG